MLTKHKTSKRNSWSDTG